MPARPTSCARRSCGSSTIRPCAGASASPLASMCARSAPRPSRRSSGRTSCARSPSREPSRPPPEAAQERHAAADHTRMTDSLPCLAVVPMYLRNEQDLDIVLRCLVSLRQTAPEVEVLVVDDCSPAAQLVDLIEIAAEELEIELCRLPVNGGFARAVNVGLRRARDAGRDALLV